MFRIFLTNLGKYNEGELIGEWVDLPCDDFDKVLTRIGVSDKPDEEGWYYEEYFITDYESDYGVKVDEYENLDKLNELAEMLEDVDPAIYEAILDHEISDPYEAAEYYHGSDYTLYPGCTSMADVAERCYEDMTSEWEKQGFPVDYIDWEKMGQNWEANGKFASYGNWNTNYGYIEFH